MNVKFNLQKIPPKENTSPQNSIPLIIKSKNISPIKIKPIFDKNNPPENINNTNNKTNNDDIINNNNKNNNNNNNIDNINDKDSPNNNINMLNLLNKKKKDTIIDDKYEIYPSTFLTKGSKTIDIVAGGDIIEPSKKYAIKFENENNINILKKEIILYDYLKSTDGFPTLYSNGNFHNQNYIILERLGPNLKELFKYCNNHFSLQTILLIGIQIITRLQDFHYKTGFIYNNIKLSNFCVGLKDTNKIYVIDLSKAKPFRYSDYQMNRYEHIPYNENTDYINITKFSSKNSQIGIEISRRDDLESLGYMLIYFANEGKLPWLINKNVVINNNNNNNNENNIDDNNNNNNKENNNNNKNNNNNNNNNNNIHNITKEEKKLFYIENKLSSTIEEFCKNLPIEFSMYMNYIENLGFYEKPDYNYLKGLFGNLLFTFYIEKFYFDWNILSPKEIPNNLRTNKELENKYEYLSSKYYYDNINPESKKKKKKKKKKKNKNNNNNNNNENDQEDEEEEIDEEELDEFHTNIQSYNKNKINEEDNKTNTEEDENDVSIDEELEEEFENTFNKKTLLSKFDKTNIYKDTLNINYEHKNVLVKNLHIEEEEEIENEENNSKNNNENIENNIENNIEKNIENNENSNLTSKNSIFNDDEFIDLFDEINNNKNLNKKKSKNNFINKNNNFYNNSIIEPSRANTSNQNSMIHSNESLLIRTKSNLSNYSLNSQSSEVFLINNNSNIRKEKNIKTKKNLPKLKVFSTGEKINEVEDEEILTTKRKKN